MKKKRFQFFRDVKSEMKRVTWPTQQRRAAALERRRGGGACVFFGVVRGRCWTTSIITPLS
ncbi:MAG: preprotein translocase subunit SecE [Adlercreutzia equolifaciens]